MSGPLLTGDGSSTLFDPATGEHYHSTFGAVTESGHVFIRSGLDQVAVSEGPVRILEIGFGTGLNALLTLLACTDGRKEVSYDALEPHPVPQAVVRELNYPEVLGGSDTREALLRLHEAEWEIRVPVVPGFTLLKRALKLEAFLPASGTYDLVYFDAFSPAVQPELWEPPVFRKIFTAMRPGGLLVTYSAKGMVSRGMKEAGFRVEKLAGPPGRRHILRGIVPGAGNGFF